MTCKIFAACIFLLALVACSRQAPSQPLTSQAAVGPDLTWNWWWDLEDATWLAQQVKLNNYHIDANFQVVDIDLFEGAGILTKSQWSTYKSSRTLPSTTYPIKDLKAKGLYVVCYFSAGSFEYSRPDLMVALGITGGVNTVEEQNRVNERTVAKLSGWNELWWDIYNANRTDNYTWVRGIMNWRLNLAEDAGCDAVEPDNTDAYDNHPFFENIGGAWGPVAEYASYRGTGGDQDAAIRATQRQVDYLVWLSNNAHSY